jgi:hypothetical protein
MVNGKPCGSGCLVGDRPVALITVDNLVQRQSRMSNWSFAIVWRLCWAGHQNARLIDKTGGVRTTAPGFERRAWNLAVEYGQ